MRHGVKKTRFNKMDSHRKALLSHLATHVIVYQRIKTTWVKAKEAQKLVEKLITLAKANTLNSRRMAISLIRDEDAVKRLFKEIGPLFKDRVGGYTRVIPFMRRRGDGAELVYLELVEKVKEEKKVKKHKAKAKAGIETAGKKADEQPKDIHKSAIDVKPEAKEERVVEDVKREKARREDTKFNEKEKHGFLKKFFRRKQGM